MIRSSTIFILLIIHVGLVYSQQELQQPQMSVYLQANCQLFEEKKYEFDPKHFAPSNTTLGTSLGLTFQPKKHLLLKTGFNYFRNTGVNTVVNDSSYPRKTYHESEYLVENKVLQIAIGSTLGNHRLKITPLVGLDTYFRKIIHEIDYKSTFNYLPNYSQSYPNIPPDEVSLRSSHNSKKWHAIGFIMGFDMYLSHTTHWATFLSTRAMYKKNGENWRIDGQGYIAIVHLGLGISYILKGA